MGERKGKIFTACILLLSNIFCINTLHGMNSPFWEGEVVLAENATFIVTAHNSGREYDIARTTALGALDIASREGGFNYTVNDKWYDKYGSLLIDSIAGKESKGNKGWLYWVNYPDEPLPWVSAEKYFVGEGDTVDFFYGEFGSNPDSASMLIRIHVHLAKDVTPPEVDILRPEGIYIFDREIIHIPGFSFVVGEVTVEVMAKDDLAGIKSVKFYIDNELKEIDVIYPYEWCWSETTVGWHTLKVVALDGAGNEGYAEKWVFCL